MFKITYDPWNGRTVPDCVVELSVLQFIELEKTYSKQDRDFEITVGSEVFINGFRVMVCNGKIQPENIEFWFVDESEMTHKMVINKNGQLDHCPKGFCNIMEDQLMVMLDSDSKS